VGTLFHEHVVKWHQSAWRLSIIGVKRVQLEPTFRTLSHRIDIFGLIFHRYCQAKYQAIEKWSIVALTCRKSA
jgi:hypothetical protein